GYDTKIFGLNLRLPEINAAIAKVQMKKLPHFLKIRKSNAKLLSELLSDLKLQLPTTRKYENVNWYLYTITTNKQSLLLKKLNEKGIGAASYYPTPVHKTPFYKLKTKLPVTDWAASHVVSLPVHPMVTPKNIEFIAKAVREIL
ncbi:MAG: DegT/DnrJ/EryC1/StrS aminotransferase family protein, partial [Nitrosopumilus sp.]|nr:DegT/DnrJ/EryC1/StrS aminotransferase family protein [Nitrosopumilus sp.]